LPDLPFPAPHQRARGELALSLRQRGPLTVLSDLRQSGCLRARFPRAASPDRLDAVLLNVGGGIAPGDRLDTTIHLAEHARATIAAQAAERIYRAASGSPPALVRTTLEIAPGASLEWLPQDTILFDDSALDRRTDIALAPTARYLGVESLVFGRAAMGETLHRLVLRDVVRLRRDGRLLLHDALRVDGDAATLRHRATAEGAGAAGTLLLASPDAEASLAPLRAALGDVEAGVSAFDGLLLARILAEDGATLRRAMTAALRVVRGGRTLPAVWTC
jgi:urease accessory protein